MDHTKIGGLIRRLRQERGLTQRQLAERMGISDKTVSKWDKIGAWAVPTCPSCRSCPIFFASIWTSS